MAWYLFSEPNIEIVEIKRIKFKLQIVCATGCSCDGKIEVERVDDGCFSGEEVYFIEFDGVGTEIVINGENIEIFRDITWCISIATPHSDMIIFE